MQVSIFDVKPMDTAYIVGKQRDVEKKIISLEEDLRCAYQSNDLIDEEIKVINAELSSITRECNRLSSGFFSFFYKRRIRLLGCEFEKMSEKSRELMLKKKTPEDIRKIEQTQEALKQTLKALRSAPSLWRGKGFPPKLDLTVVTEYKDLFSSLTSEITNVVPFINIILVGEAAAGKSSLVNTFATALDGGKTIKTICNSGPLSYGPGSLTSTNHIEALHIGENMLHVRLHDLPGIAHTTIVREDELNMVIDGKIKPNAKIQTALEMAQNKDILRENPKPADKMHCIIYVIRATFNTALDCHQSDSLKVLRNIRNKRKAEGIMCYIYTFFKN